MVAIEQAYLLNRLGSFVPGGLMYALRRDVVSLDGDGQELRPGRVQLRRDKRPRPLTLRMNEGDCLEVHFQNLLATEWPEEGGIPSHSDGRLPAGAASTAGRPMLTGQVQASPVSLDAPRTRAASFHVTGLELAPIRPEECPVDVACGGDGTNTGGAGADLRQRRERQGIVFNPATIASARDEFDLGSLAKPGQRVVTRWQASREGGYLAYSAAAPVGGEGDGGQIGLGLFAAVNVEPRGSVWYRSQVTHEELRAVTRPPASGRHDYADIDYDQLRSEGGRDVPILRILDPATDEIVHSDLNAVIVLPETGPDLPANCAMYGTVCRASFREFTVILHDEVHASQAFARLDDPNDPLYAVRDGMGINYGVSSMGALMMTTPLQGGNGVAGRCPECQAEEFFLSSWANGDPALILGYSGDQPVGARYPDDPSNVHHAYLGDPVRFRNLHAGPKETHVFHLHAHQWALDGNDPDSSYLDSQTISPGASFSYGIEFGGAGNRNHTVGDSIFHCHLYPHFAQGMWELWRVHDTFEDGLRAGMFDPSRPVVPFDRNHPDAPANDPRSRSLPDAEVAAGTATPAVLPIPGNVLAPLPTAEFRGYPFYIPGEAGHRPPQPVLDMDVLPSAGWFDPSAEPPAQAVVNGGLPRHVVTQGTLTRNDPQMLRRARESGGTAARIIAQRVSAQDGVALSALASEWNTLTIRQLQHSGEPAERAAMTFHEGRLTGPGLVPVAVPPPAADDPRFEWWRPAQGYRTDRAALVARQLPRSGEPLFQVNAQPRAAGAPFANPCPVDAPLRDYRAAFIQTEITTNRHGWFDPQARIVVLEDDIADIIDPATRTRLPEPLFFRANSGECIRFLSSNFVPRALNVDDFQIYTPTDTIGQHIHLVKFDVTSSDGSGNGFNYEDGTFSPDEVRERIFAHNRSLPAGSTAPRLVPQPHPLFRPGGSIFEAAGGDVNHPVHGRLLERGLCPAKAEGETDTVYEHRLRERHPFCGAQRTTQRWWADPILNRRRRDNTLRTVFTHDHFGPSSHQQHGLYAGLVIEPANSLWVRAGETLTADEVATLSDPASTARGRLLGGSDLSRPTAPVLRREREHLLSPIEPRAPLRLRGDGGPTATIANIIAPECIGDGDSNRLQPEGGRNRPAPPQQDCENGRTEQTRREFALAIADFGVSYNMALEPINPEPRGDSILRDRTLLQFGRRHVATTPARPLAISSEDPGSQFVNYRHEPLALRISEFSPDERAGGFDYRQSDQASDGAPCRDSGPDCRGDMANAFSTRVHAGRDERLARHGYLHPSTQRVNATAMTRDALSGTPAASRLQPLLAEIEQWRRDFNCALYPASLLPAWQPEDAPERRAELCHPRIERREPWRVFGDPATPILPAYEGDPVQIRLVQGAQEAQHVFTMNGVRWRRVPASPDSGFTSAQPLGISEHFEFDVRVNTLNAPHVDYLYSGSSVDQLWDGMWGVLRSFGRWDMEDTVALGPLPTREVASSATTGPVSFEPWRFLAPVVPEPPPLPASRDAEDASCDRTQAEEANILRFDISAVRVCDLYGDCGAAQRSGLIYNRRSGIRDDLAMIFVQNSVPDSARSNADVLRTLRQEFGPGGRRQPEPLVLRAAAGQCMQVTLRNHLPQRMEDGPPSGPDGAVQEVPEHLAYHNFLPMITDGFNVNQFRMSSVVGLSAATIAQHPISADGSNVGLNGAVADADTGPNGFFQGSLVPPCRTGTDENCRSSFFWSATDLELARDGQQANRAVEYGAVPLRSFGDPVKHPMHGLGGALVIGPAGSRVCDDDRFTVRHPASQGEGGAELPGYAYPPGVSARVCTADGGSYVDHVLMFQDGVNVTRGGLPVANLSGAEEPDDYGVRAINYRTDPLWARRGDDPQLSFEDRNAMDYSRAMSSRLMQDGSCDAGIAPLPELAAPCDPETSVFRARAGEAMRLHLVHPGGHTRQHGVAVSGHNWNLHPWSEGSHVFDPRPGGSIRQGVVNGFGPMMALSLPLRAGGAAGLPMDYLFRSQASFQFDGGVWGILRIEPPASPSTGRR